jgi:WD40 repeat protein
MRTQTLLIVVVLISTTLVATSRGRTREKDSMPAKSAVFYVPAKVTVLDKPSHQGGRKGDLVLRKGAVVECTGGSYTWFVEAGASLSTVGGSHVFIVKKGGILPEIVGGKHHVYCEKGAKLEASIRERYPVVEFESISFEPFQAFTLKGLVRDSRGESLPGIKVRAFGLDGEVVAESVSDGEGAFLVRPAKQVRCLVADLGSVWRKDVVLCTDGDLEFRRHVGRLRGWETEIREGFWGRDASVSILQEHGDLLSLPPATDFVGHELSIQAVAFSNDGARLVTVSFAGRPIVWDIKSGRELRKLRIRLTGATIRGPVHSDAPWPAALDSSGNNLAFSRFDVGLSLWNVTTGELIRELRGHKRNVRCAVFSPDGRTLASGGADGTIRLWDVSSGAARHVIAAHNNGVTSLAFAGDGKHLFSTGTIEGGDNKNVSFDATDAVRIWDAATARALRTLPGGADFLVFSADGKRMAGAGTPMKYERVPPDGFRMGSEPLMLVWDSATGRQVMKVAEKAETLAFTRDGLLLQAASGDSLHLWEVDSGQKILTCPLPRRTVCKLAFSADARMLAAGQKDGTVSLWDIRAHHLYVPASKRRSDAEWEKLWDDLAADKAATAYRALWTLLHEPPRAVELLKKHLRSTPVRQLPLAKWIADLDHDDFERRQAAEKSLREAGDAAEDALRQARANKPSLEARKRIGELLDEIGQRRPSAEELRSLRAIQLLEEIGSPEARQLLTTLAKGWSASRQTREANAALNRSRPIPKGK